MLISIINMKNLALLTYLGIFYFWAPIHSFIQKLFNERMGSVIFSAQYHFLSFSSRCFHDLDYTVLQYWECILYIPLYLSAVLKQALMLQHSLLVSISVLLWAWILKLNLCYRLFFFPCWEGQIKTEKALCFLLLEVQSLADNLKGRCSDQGNTGVNIYMEKICWTLHIHKQGNSVWVFQEEQNERMIPDSLCILLLFNSK